MRGRSGTSRVKAWSAEDDANLQKWRAEKLPMVRIAQRLNRSKEAIVQRERVLSEIRRGVHKTQQATIDAHTLDMVNLVRRDAGVPEMKLKDFDV